MSASISHRFGPGPKQIGYAARRDARNTLTDMTDQAVRRPAIWGFAWPASLGAVMTFLLTVVTPAYGFLAGIVGLVVLCFGLARHHTGLVTAVSAGVVAAVVCYLGIAFVAWIVDPPGPASGSESSDGPSALKLVQLVGSNRGLADRLST